MTAANVISALANHANADDAVFLQRFFKTGKGQYGEGDIFIGVRVPQTRAVCKQFVDLPLTEMQKLLDSGVHEHRLAGAILLTYKYAKADAAIRGEIYKMYLKNVRAVRINNWDIVDTTCRAIVGRWLWDNEAPRDVLFDLARSPVLWQRRVGVISTFYFLDKGDASTSLAIADLLVNDTEDLMHKAVGWMLREIGKRVDRKLLIEFLDKHARSMPRTTLRYAIEHLPPSRRQHYLSLKSMAQ